MDHQAILAAALLARVKDEVRKAKEGDTDACEYVLQSLEYVASGDDVAAAGAQKQLSDLRTLLAAEVQNNPQLKEALKTASESMRPAWVNELLQEDPGES